MVLFRFLAIVFLAYLGYRFLCKIKQENKKTLPEKEDILEKDPICKRLIPRRQAIVYEENGAKVYFCSKECCRTYQNNNKNSEAK